MSLWSLDVRGIKKFKLALPRYTEEETLLKDTIIWWSFNSAGQDFTYIPKSIKTMFSLHILILVGNVQIMLPCTDNASTIFFIWVRRSRWFFKKSLSWIFTDSTASLPIKCNTKKDLLLLYHTSSYSCSKCTRWLPQLKRLTKSEVHRGRKRQSSVGKRKHCQPNSRLAGSRSNKEGFHGGPRGSDVLRQKSRWQADCRVQIR